MIINSSPIKEREDQIGFRPIAYAFVFCITVDVK